MGNFVVAMYVNKNGANKDACLAWINEFTQPEYMDRFNIETGTLATFKDCKTAELHPAVTHIYETMFRREMLRWSLMRILMIRSTARQLFVLPLCRCYQRTVQR